MVVSVPPGGNWKDIPVSIPSKRLERIRETGGRTTLYGRLHWDRPSYTVTTYFNRPGNGTYIHPVENRVITAREAARLQSFPDQYLFLGSKTSFCKQIGNAVPPLLAFSLAKQIKKITKTKNLLDLFCGSGGLSLGFEMAGYKIVAANDNFKAACMTYRENHKKTILVEGDITNDDVKNELYDVIKNKKIDIIVGGPPCQGFSHAGKRIIDDPRNFLYKEFVTMVKEIKPKVFVMENVEGIITSNNGMTFSSIKENFESLGYKVHGEKLLAVEYGVPQKRKRVVIIGVMGGDPKDCLPKKLTENSKKYVSVKDAISNLSFIKPSNNEINVKCKIQSVYQSYLSGNISADEYTKKIS
jgi:DNA-cytosine methyltransferase